MFLVPIMCTLTLTPLLGKKDKIRASGGTLEISELSNFTALPFLHLAWGVQVSDFSKVQQQQQQKVATRVPDSFYQVAQHCGTLLA